MKTKIIVGILVLSLSFPAASHAFGLLRYVFDAVSNQLGLDRGPIPKTLPKPPTPPPGQPGAHNPNAGGIYIQAEGF
jgi:hypothetical protein